MVDDTDAISRAAISMIPRRNRDYASHVNQIIAHNSARSELSGGQRSVRLDDGARDTVIFYGRQDTGHALLNTVSLLRLQRTTNQLLGVLIALAVVVIILNIAELSH